mmetsp:Transcript_21689/g.66844  ORF Transcript_21689/g.66844 Transcript_21689/m.66844 type:complete len:265 (-) Transcript_21689:120-914(-)
MWVCFLVMALPCTWALSALAPAPSAKVRVFEDAAAVGAEVSRIVDEAARKAIAERGAFFIGVPGGSVLKMLVRGDVPDWSAKTTLAWVNHKCVDVDDAALSTRAKASFLDEWPGCTVLDVSGGADADAEARAYEARLRSLEGLRRTDDGLPQFDLMLVGVGDDGHVGSLYPNRDEVLETERWVLPVAMKQPPSITLSLPVMASADAVVIAACGVSDKYPQGKSDAMHRAVQAPRESLQSFPAAGLRHVATYCFDKAAASKLTLD